METNQPLSRKELRQQERERKHADQQHQLRKQKMKKSLDEIEAGDEVYYNSRYYSKILKVDRVTPTTIICGTEKFGAPLPSYLFFTSGFSVRAL
jgi:hypothetical protein